MNKTLILLAAVFVLAGCGTENPFDRGPETIDDVVDGPITGTVSFSSNVVPLLTACASCHSGGAGGWTYAGGASAYAAVRAVVDPQSPTSSSLLVNATGGDGHGGGTIFSTSSSQYATIRAWIEQGAADN